MSAAGDPHSRQRLLELADQITSTPFPEPSSRRRSSLAGVGAILAVVLLGGGAAMTAVALSGDDDGPAATDTSETASGAAPTTAAQNAATTGVAPAAGAASTTAAPTTAAPTTAAPTTAAPTTAASTTAAPTTAAPTTVPAAPAPVDAATDQAAAEQPVRWAEFRGGKVYLQGVVPDQATADEIRDKAAAVVGPDNVVVEYAIVAGAPRPESAPLYVRDSVLFARNSVDINAAARGVLDLGVVLMNQNPQVTIDISGHTDADGTPEANQALSQRRVEVILAYLVSQGIDPSRLTTAAFGETQPIADNATAEGRAANRRVEFQINDLLG